LHRRKPEAKDVEKSELEMGDVSSSDKEEATAAGLPIGEMMTSGMQLLGSDSTECTALATI
jgi:hypothetical protein